MLANDLEKRRCTFSIEAMSLTKFGDQTAAAHSKCGRTQDLNAVVSTLELLETKHREIRIDFW